jgi:membrane protein
MIAPILTARIEAPADGWSKVTARLWQRIRDGRISLIAAGCAFYATLALFPGLSMLVSLYGLVFNPVSVVPQLTLLQDVLPPEAFQLISHQVHALVLRRPADLKFNVILTAVITLWSSSTGTKSIMSAIGHTLGSKPAGMVRFQLTGLGMTLCAALAAVLAIAILVALPRLAHLFVPRGMLRIWLHVASLVVLIGFVWASIVTLYHFSPHHPRGGHVRLLPGSMVAIVLWFAASALLSVYIGRIAPLDTTYGPLAAVAGVMLWFWISTYVVLLGAELNAALEMVERKDAPDDAEPD